MSSPSGAPRGWRIGLVVVLVLGCALRTMQFLGRPSLWFDELALALNIVERPFAELVSRPLDHAQLAPVGFLSAVKGATAVLGDGEAGLRLVPWLSGCAALFLFWRVARRFLGDAALVGALLLVAASPALVWYGGNVKPYAGDVAVSLLLVLLALRSLERPDDRASAAVGGVIGACALPLSYPSVPTAAVLGALLAARWMRRRSRSDTAALLSLLAPWFVSSALCGVVALQLADPGTRAYMDRFWADGFPPPPWRGVAALLWVPLHLYDALGNLLLFIAAGSAPGQVYVGACSALAVVGLAALVRASAFRASLLLAPTLAAVLAAAVHLLPFQGRVGLYAGWPLLLAAMAGLEALHTAARGHVRRAVVVLGATLSALPAILVLLEARPPYRSEEARPVLAEVALRSRPGDDLLVYYGARWAIRFYGPRSGLAGWTVGECHREDPRAYFREVDRFRGSARVWFVYTHGALGYREPEVIRSYFDAIGVERERIPDPYGLEGQSAAAAYLYDLSDPARLAATSADGHRHPEVTTGATRILCDGTRLEGR